jgi:hypothetical protein
MNESQSARGTLMILAAFALGGVLLLIGSAPASARMCRQLGSNCRSNAECCSTQEQTAVCQVPPGKCVCQFSNVDCQCADHTSIPITCAFTSSCAADVAACLANSECAAEFASDCGTACTGHGGATSPPIACSDVCCSLEG